ncbi:TIM barrel protein [Candidatus Woesearchaeota archaeon]|nr:TIM barrel protein [Candidatus Woesearchaeota archaeon]
MIKLGPAGTSGLGYPDGLAHCKESGLGALEVEFTHGVHMNNATASEVGKLAKQANVDLSVHAPYYINLSSEEKPKVTASKKRILMSAERAHYLGAKYVVFHAGYYGKKDPEDVYLIMVKELTDMQNTIKAKKWNVVLAPETTGKASQFAGLDDLLKLRKEIKCEICVDFAHIMAREQGKTTYDKILDKLKGIKHLHTHFSGIEWTAKGEKRHLLTQAKDIKELLNSLIKHKADATIINESPDPFGDALKTKKILDSLR